MIATSQAPITEASYYILLSLLEPMHGYAIMQNVDKISHGHFKLGPATLYTVLSKLVDEKLIAREDDVTSSDERRKVYVISERGKQLLRGEIIRRYLMVKVGLEALEKMGVNLDEALKQYDQR